uniref:Uncharacterized protein n=1 Tax=Anguilla anguilla TaxID=7936 RepID=A0A0E9Q6Q3_ANGAN
MLNYILGQWLFLIEWFTVSSFALHE